MTVASSPDIEPSLVGLRIGFVGRLAGMSKREAAQEVRRHGATVVERPDATVNLFVVGEDGMPLGDVEANLADNPDIRAAIDANRCAVITESQLWQRLGLVALEQDVHRLYTPAMLAELLGVSVAVIRRWHRRGLIQPAKEVRRLPYFDFQEVATARRLAEMLAEGMSPAAIEKKLAQLARFFPHVRRPLAQLSVIVEGKEILLRQGDGLVEPGGQLRFDFAAAESAPDVLPVGDAVSEAPTEPGDTVPLDARQTLALAPAPAPDQILASQAESPERLAELAAQYEEEGELETATDLYRSAMAAGGPKAEFCFQLAELLYRLGDPAGARERYFMAIELDEDYVEARANLGCVLAELGQHELARAAFEGALAFHPDYSDVHYHLARLLDATGRPDDASVHWHAFLCLAPTSPWAEQARLRVAEASPPLGD